MPGPPLVYSSGVAAAAPITSTTELVVATVSGITIEQTARSVQLSGTAIVTTGTTTTAVVARIRRTSLTGTLISDQTGQTIQTAAGGTDPYGVQAVDTPGQGTGFSYVLTIQNTGGGTGGTTVYAVLTALVC